MQRYIKPSIIVRHVTYPYIMAASLSYTDTKGDNTKEVLSKQSYPTFISDDEENN